MSMLLCTDVPEMTEILDSELQERRRQRGVEAQVEDVLAVTTRAQAEQKTRGAEISQQEQMQSGVGAKPLVEWEEPSS